MSNSVTIAEVENYSMRVQQGKISCCLPPCSRCDTLAAFFKRHEARKRIFYVLCEQFIHRVLCLITRWKCTGCGKTFILYPPFALPYKRYTLQTIMQFSKRYLEDNSFDERQLAHSTLHRWISTVGGFKSILRSALDLILQNNPATTVHRDMAAFRVAPEKYRKADRKEVLIGCRQIIHTQTLYRRAFHTSIFPYLATCCGWT